MKRIVNNISSKTGGLFLLAAFIITLSSCHKEVSPTNQVGSTYTVNYSQVFEDFWNSMNKTYVFWSIEKTDWDKVHRDFAPAFKRLDDEVAYYSSDMMALKAARLFKQIVDGLVDSHYSLSLITGYGINPSLDRKWENPEFIGNLFMDKNGSITQLYPDNINYYNVGVDSMYLEDKVAGYDSLSGFYSVSGIIKNTNILYFSFSTFSLLSQYQSGTNPNVKASIDNFFTKLTDPKVTSLIIDVRGNGGGETSDLNFLLGRLVSKPLKIGYTKSKSGPGRLDYTPWADAIVKPWYGFPSGFNKPIAVLADGLSASMAELTAMTVKALPNSIFVGDTTWGANGPLTQNSDFNAGSFSFGNLGTNVDYGITYYYGSVYTSSCMFKYLDNKIYEGKGFPPDYVVKVTPDQIFLPDNVVDDPQLNKAISLLPK